MTNLSKTIIAKSDQLNSDDLIGGSITITITDVRGCDEGEQPIAVHFEGDDRKPYKPCKSMRRVLVFAWGPEGKDYIGKRMTLFRDEGVQFGGIKVGGIRISHMSHIPRDTTWPLAVKRGQKQAYTVKALRAPVEPLDQARRSPPREEVEQHDVDDGGFPGDRVKADDYDPAVWASEQNRLLETFRSVAEIDAHTNGPGMAESFGRLHEASPGLANSLNAAFRGRRKALASREQG